MCLGELARELSAIHVRIKRYSSLRSIPAITFPAAPLSVPLSVVLTRKLFAERDYNSQSWRAVARSLDDIRNDVRRHVKRCVDDSLVG